MEAQKKCPCCGISLPYAAKYCPYCDNSLAEVAGVRGFVREDAPASSDPAAKAAPDPARIANGMAEILAARKRQNGQPEKNAADDEKLFVYAASAAADGWIVCGFSGADPANLAVPEKHNGQPVIGIGREAFRGLAVTSVVLPGSIQKIGEGAFRDCRLLYEIQDGSGLRVIGKDAFRGCGLLARFSALSRGGICTDYTSFAGCYQLGLEAESRCTPG